MMEGGPDEKLRAAVHLTAGEAVDGIVLWRHEGREGESARSSSCCLADDAPARSRCGEFLGNMDLVTTSATSTSRPGDPLPWALPTSTRSGSPRFEFLWVRVLDVPAPSPPDPGPTTARWCSRSTTPRATPPAATRSSPGRGGRGHPHRGAADVTVDAETLGSLSVVRGRHDPPRGRPGRGRRVRGRPVRGDGRPPRRAVQHPGFLARRTLAPWVG